MSVSIDFDKCSYCMECVDSCTSGAISEYDGEIILAPDLCRREEYCVFACSEEAITITFPTGRVWEGIGNQ